MPVDREGMRGRADRLRAALPPPRAGAAPPEERGQRLATVARGPGEELRVTWDEYEGRPYLSIRVWTRDAGGGWWPDGKRGVSVRVRELAAFADGVSEALDLAAELAEHPGEARPEPWAGRATTPQPGGEARGRQNEASNPHQNPPRPGRWGGA